MQFDARELQLIRDSEFLLTKNTILRKVHELLDRSRSEIRGMLDDYNLKDPPIAEFKHGKISRGENYRGLPYLVLDYPALYARKDIFAFRTIFWWGNFFSTSIHLQGSFLDKYRSILATNIASLVEEQYFICVGHSPWEYHYGKDNYRLIMESDKKLIEKVEFLKLSKKYSLDDWKELPVLAKKFVTDIISLLIDPV